MFFAVFLDTDNLQYSEDTDHDESVFVSVVRSHELWYLSTELRHEDEEYEYRHHEHTPIGSCPVSECTMIWTEVLGLEYRKSTNNHDEKECEYTRFRHSHNSWFCHLGESLLEHIECGEEDDEESEPLDRWKTLEHLRYPARSNNHEDNRDDETNSEIDHVPMTGTCDSEDIIERHGDVSDDDRLDSLTESCCWFSTFFVVFMCAYLTVELPYDVEEEYCSEELESWYLHEEDNSEWEYDTQYRCTCHSPEYRLASEFWGEVLGCHTDEDGIVSTHDEVDEDDVEQCKCSCRSEKMHEVWLQCHDEFWHSIIWLCMTMISNPRKMQFFWQEKEEVVE